MQSLKKYESPWMKVAIVAMVLLVIVLIRATWSVYQKSVHTAAKRDQVAREMEHLEDRQEFLIHETARLQTEEGIDEEIRDQFGFAEAGERVFIILDDTEATTTEVAEISFWQRLMMWFGTS